MTTKRPVRRHSLTFTHRHPHPNHPREQPRLRADWLQRTQPATVTIACAANHLTSLGQARDEMERKA